MKTYKVVKTINGSANATTIDTFDNIEDARECLYTELRHCANDNEYYFAAKADAEAEIAFADEQDTRESWGDDECDTYISALREGIETGAPFIADRDGNVIGCECDRFYYDNFSVEIKVDDNIATLNDLAALINDCDDFPTQEVEAACERNGWVMGDDEWHIASDGESQVIFDDQCNAVVVDL